MARSGLAPWTRDELAPRDSFRALHAQMDDLLASFFGRRRGADGEGGFWPAVDVSESDGHVKVNAELPGMEGKDIEATIEDDDVLVLKGEKRQEKEEKGEESYRLERSYGAFRREIPLPCKVDANKVAATFAKGVLTVTVPKAPSKNTKKIDVKAA